MNYATRILLACFGIVAATGAAVAGPIATHVPEPMSLSLLAGGVVAIVVIRQMRGK